MRPWIAFACLLLASPALAAVGDCDALTPLQVAAGFVTWLNVLKVFAILLAVGCLAVLTRHWIGRLLAFFMAIPRIVYELLGHAAALSVLVYAKQVPATDQLWPVLGGALFWGVMIAITLERSKSDNVSGFCAILTVAWGIIAMAFHSEAVGFFAVLALMGMVGFSAWITPLSYAVGFSKDDTAQATAAALLITIGATAWHIAGAGTVPNPFEYGALWIGPIVAGIGLLIIASRHYGFSSKIPYIVRQIAPIVFGVVATFVGTTFGVPHLAGIAGTFFVLYAAEKIIDIPASSMVGYATVGLLLAAVLGGGVWWAQHHMDVIQPFLLF